MFAKFVCVIAILASTSAMAGAKGTAVPTAGIKEIYVDEISRGGWSGQAEARYDSWIDGIDQLHVKNCQTPVHYKVDAALCDQLTKLMEYIRDTVKVMLSNNGVSANEK